MVGHQDVGMYSDMVPAAGGFQAFKIKDVVMFREEAGIAIIASLYDMAGDAWYIQAGFSWHGNSFCVNKNKYQLSPTPLKGPVQFAVVDGFG